MSTRNDFVKQFLVANRSLAGFLVISLVFTTVTSQAFAVSPDFVVSSPYRLGPVLPGTGVTASVYVNSTGGFAGTVNLSVAASPAGIRVSITSSLNIVSGGYNTAQLGIATDSAPPANYTITITGVSGSLAHSIKTSIVVLPAPPDFSLSVSPSSMNLQAGGSGSSTLTVTSLHRFSGTVTLTVCPDVPTPPCQPSTLTTSANPASVSLTANGTATSTIHIGTSTSTPTTTYSAWVYATGGGLVHQAVINVAVGPYFTLSASPSSLTLPASTSASSTLLLTSHANFSFTANFQMTVSGPGPQCWPPYCPVLPTVTITPSTVNLPAFGTATTTLTVATATNTTTGLYGINVFGGGCVCILPQTTVYATVTSPPSGNVNQTLTFDGVKATLTGSLSASANTVSGSITVTATNATTGAIIFSKTFTILFTIVSTNNPRFVMILPVNPHELGVTCAVNMSNSQSSCFLSRDPAVAGTAAISIVDVSIIMGAYNTFAGATNFNPALDLLAHGHVDIVDISIVLADYNAPTFY